MHIYAIVMTLSECSCHCLDKHFLGHEMKAPDIITLSNAIVTTIVSGEWGIMDLQIPGYKLIIQSY